jgi:hypothetical protein
VAVCYGCAVGSWFDVRRGEVSRARAYIVGGGEWIGAVEGDGCLRMK